MKRVSISSENEKTIMIITGILILVLIVDMELSNVADIIHKSISSEKGVITFIVISIIYLSSQYMIIRFAKAKTVELRARKKDVRHVTIAVFAVEAIIISVFVLAIIEILFQGYYGSVGLIIVLIISNGLAAWIMFILSKRLYVYYKSNHDRTILSYLVSSIIFSITVVVTMFIMVPLLVSKPTIITSTTAVSVSSIIPGSAFYFLYFSYYVLNVISFLSVWVATAMLLFTYSKKLGKMRFWIVISLPLIFYVSQIIVAEFKSLLPFGDLDPLSFVFYYAIIFTLGNILGGILFATPFILISRMIPRSNIMHHRFIIFGLGMVLTFVAGGATVTHSPFPPFGLATVALIGISSYLLFLGLYSTAISLSEDSRLRKQIRKSAQDWKFFMKLSDAEIEKRVVDQVEAVKDSMTTDTGVAPSISIEEAKDYLSEVLNEMKKEQVK